MLKRLFKHLKRKAPADGRLSALDDLLSKAPEELDTTRLFPIVLPIELATSDWPGPIEQIEPFPFAVAWGVSGELNSLVYVTNEHVEHWNSIGFDWRSQSIDNLRQRSTPGANGEKCDREGKPFVKVMLHDDGLGPSRLLLPHLFDYELGEDYLVAIPERTCAIAYRRELTDDQCADVDGMIGGCFAHGTEPVSPERYDPAPFWSFAERVGKVPA
jgi:hypothetical protein